jgi:DNA-binding response OmpR family regulator
MIQKSIMIVEDEILTAMSIEAVVTEKGYDVCDIISKGSIAIEKALERKPDLLIMDIILKDEIDGISVVKKIHEKFYIPVIYLTASSDPETSPLQKERNLYTTSISLND